AKPAARSPEPGRPSVYFHTGRPRPRSSTLSGSVAIALRSGATKVAYREWTSGSARAPHFAPTLSRRSELSRWEFRQARRRMTGHTRRGPKIYQPRRLHTD